MSGKHSPLNPGQHQAGVRIESRQMLRIAPLPTVQEFGGYEAVLPGAAERIMRQAERMTDMAEKQQRHRFELETRVVDGNLRSQNTGMWIGGVLCMSAIVGGLALLLTGKPVEGLIGLITPLALLAGVFVYGRNQQVQQLAEKRAAEMLQEADRAGTGLTRR